MFEGTGTILFEDIVDNDELYNLTNLYSVITLKQNCGIGYHQHIGEEEVMLIIKGNALYNDDGLECVVTKGDVCICKEGHHHSILNQETEDVVVIALKLKETK